MNDGTLTTYIAVSWDGRTEFFSAYCEMAAFQDANDWAQPEGLQSLEEV